MQNLETFETETLFQLASAALYSPAYAIESDPAEQLYAIGKVLYARLLGVQDKASEVPAIYKTSLGIIVDAIFYFWDIQRELPDGPGVWGDLGLRVAGVDSYELFVETMNGVDERWVSKWEIRDLPRSIPQILLRCSTPQQIVECASSLGAISLRRAAIRICGQKLRLSNAETTGWDSEKLQSAIKIGLIDPLFPISLEAALARLADAKSLERLASILKEADSSLSHVSSATEPEYVLAEVKALLNTATEVALD